MKHFGKLTILSVAILIAGCNEPSEETPTGGALFAPEEASTVTAQESSPAVTSYTNETFRYTELFAVGFAPETAPLAIHNGNTSFLVREDAVRIHAFGNWSNTIPGGTWTLCLIPDAAQDKLVCKTGDSSIEVEIFSPRLDTYHIWIQFEDMVPDMEPQISVEGRVTYRLAN